MLYAARLLQVCNNLNSNKPRNDEMLVKFEFEESRKCLHAYVYFSIFHTFQHTFTQSSINRCHFILQLSILLEKCSLHGLNFMK